MGNWCEPTGTSEKLEDIGGSKDCDGNEKVGMVQAREKKKHKTSEQLPK